MTCWKAHREDLQTLFGAKDSWQYIEREEEGALDRKSQQSLEQFDTSIPWLRRRQLDYSVGFQREALPGSTSRSGRHSSAPSSSAPSSSAPSLSAIYPTSWPRTISFLACEVRCGAASLDVAIGRTPTEGCASRDQPEMKSSASLPAVLLCLVTSFLALRRNSGRLWRVEVHVMQFRAFNSR